MNNSQLQILNVYPNPTIGLTTVQIKSKLKDTKLYLINALGYIINEFDVSNLTEFSFNLEHYPVGTYQLVLVQGGFFSSLKSLILN